MKVLELLKSSWQSEKIRLLSWRILFTFNDCNSLGYIDYGKYLYLPCLVLLLNMTLVHPNFIQLPAILR